MMCSICGRRFTIRGHKAAFSVIFFSNFDKLRPEVAGDSMFNWELNYSSRCPLVQIYALTCSIRLQFVADRNLLAAQYPADVFVILTEAVLKKFDPKHSEAALSAVFSNF